MKHDAIVDGEAMSEVEGNDVTYLLGSARIIDLQQDPQRAAFVRYRVAFRMNAERHSLSTAVGLVNAYRDFRTVMGLDD